MNGPVDVSSCSTQDARRRLTVDRNLLQVDTNTVVLSIAVEEHAELKKWVGAVLDTRNHATR